MACTKPIPAQKYFSGKTGKSNIRLKGTNFKPNLELNCNNCLSCRLRKAKEWALRCWHESQMHDTNCFVTLTYDDKHIPDYHNLDHRDFQLFMKALRNKLGHPITFFMCGEYGDGTHRPHYHVLLFGYFPTDAQYHRTQNGNRYYKSEILDSAWKCGFTDTSHVSYKASGYIARYTLKKQLPKEDAQDRYCYVDPDGELHIRKFEYVRMSTGRDKWTGIGGKWIQKYSKQTLEHDYVLDPDGNQCPVPSYYQDYLAAEVCAETAEQNKLARIEKARNDPNNDPSRLPAKAICAAAKSKQLIRPYL